MGSARSVPRGRQFVVSLVLSCICLSVDAPAVQAQTSANSSAFGVEVNLVIDPPLVSPVPITLGPLPAGVSGSGTTAYSDSGSVASVSLSPPLTGDILSTGLLIGTASALLPTEQVDGAATVNQLDVTIVGDLLIPLIALTATTVQSTAQVTGDCSTDTLMRVGTSTLTNASISVSGGMAVAIAANPTPNTTLLAGTLGPLGITITLNEQIPTGDGTTFAGLTVRAIHINLSVDLGLLGALTGDIIIAESQAELVCDDSLPTATATATATGTATGTAAATATATATATGTATGTAAATATATATTTGTTTGTATSAPATATATAAGSATATGTATSTRTITNTRTATSTPTQGPPIIDPPLNPGDTRVPGSGPPNRSDGQMLICLIGGQPPNVPNPVPCQAPDSVISQCGTTGGGIFFDQGFPGCVVPPLVIGQCVYAYDTVTMLISNVVCVAPAAPAPALSPRLIGLALAMLTAIAALALHRRRRHEARSDT